MVRRRLWQNIILLPVLGLASCGSELDGPAPDPVPAVLADTELWFVEFEGDSLAGGGEARALDRAKLVFDREVADNNISLVERHRFRQLWNGVSVQVSSADVARLGQLEGVRRLHPVLQIEPPPAGVPVPSDGTELFSSGGMIGADIARNTLGFTGLGIKVGIIDTGLDWGHPDLGGCFGPGCRVAYGWDFVGDGYDSSISSVQPHPDNDPDDNCNGHGTHVAGIIGAKGTLTGVAPDVTFGSYRVFGCTGTTQSDLMLAAMEAAYMDGMRVINISIGATFQVTNYPTAVATQRLLDRGVVVVTSNGNSGASGVWAGSSPGAGFGSLATGAIENVMVTLPAFSISSDNMKIGYNTATAAPLPPKTGSLDVTRTGTTTTVDDACVALPVNSLTGKAVLIRRGTCGFAIKAVNAQNAGAAAVILYNNAVGLLTPTVAGTPAVTIPVVALTMDQGALLNSRLDAGALTMTWTAEVGQVSNAPLAGLVASFSSLGPNSDLQMKPDVSAPGGGIWSTFPLAIGGYANLSGTSMASPHVAGSVALILQAKPGIRPDRIRDLLQNTAIPVGSGVAGVAEMDSVVKQGAGMIHVDAALQAHTLVVPGRLNLGEVATTATASFEIENQSDAEITYDLASVNALAITGVSYTYGRAISTPTVAFPDGTSVTVAPGAIAKMRVSVTPSAGLANKALFSGYVTITERGTTKVSRVPYLGMKGDYQAVTILTPVAPQLARQNPSTGVFTNLPSGGTFTLLGGDVPFFRVHLDHFAMRLKADLFSTSGKAYGVAMDIPDWGKSSTATSVYNISWGGGVTLNKQLYLVPNGTYRMRIQVLKALGDASNAADWETWTSPIITLNHP
jgi:minor extracellular serine protease Vpr